MSPSSLIALNTIFELMTHKKASRGSASTRKFSRPQRPSLMRVRPVQGSFCPHLPCSIPPTLHSGHRDLCSFLNIQGLFLPCSLCPCHSFCSGILLPDTHIARILTFSGLCSNVTLSEHFPLPSYIIAPSAYLFAAFSY